MPLDLQGMWMCWENLSDVYRNTSQLTQWAWDNFCAYAYTQGANRLELTTYMVNRWHRDNRKNVHTKRVEDLV